jgi:hypothetical protein
MSVNYQPTLARQSHMYHPRSSRNRIPVFSDNTGTFGVKAWRKHSNRESRAMKIELEAERRGVPVETVQQERFDEAMSFHNSTARIYKGAGTGQSGYQAEPVSDSWW